MKRDAARGVGHVLVEQQENRFNPGQVNESYPLKWSEMRHSFRNKAEPARFGESGCFCPIPKIRSHSGRHDANHRKFLTVGVLVPRACGMIHEFTCSILPSRPGAIGKRANFALAPAAPGPRSD